MGGMNHQPCKTYLQNSTKLSRHMSLAFASLQLANVALEDVILAELDDKRGSVDNIILHLIDSEGSLVNMKRTLTDLEQQMSDNNFEDLPPLATINLDLLGTSLTVQGMHKSAIEWSAAANVMGRLGFRGMILAFSGDIDELLKLTDELQNKVEAARELAKAGSMHEMLEENRSGNFKAEFASLYTAWASFQQLFLASSLISTELWYQFNLNGSLVDSTEHARAVA